MSESLLPSPYFNKNLSKVKNLPVSSNSKVNELLGVPPYVSMEETGAHCLLKSCVKKSHRHTKKSIWSEYVKNQTRKSVKFHSLTRVLRYDEERGVRGANETLEDLMTDTIQQNKNAKYRKMENISYQDMLKILQRQNTSV